MDYAYQWVREQDFNGYYGMAGSRPVNLFDKTKPNTIRQDTYYANDPHKFALGYGDEESIRATFIKYKELI